MLKTNSASNNAPTEFLMHLEKPSLAKPLQGPSLKGYSVLQKIFFAPTEWSQSAGEAFVSRLMQRKEDREPVSGPDVAQAQMAAFRDWEKFTEKRFAELAAIRQPTLVVNGVYDEMIPISLLTELEPRLQKKSSGGREYQTWIDCLPSW
jgi:pimeloyl-ACP methyl ester carboxylesterase